MPLAPMIHEDYECYPASSLGVSAMHRNSDNASFISVELVDKPIGLFHLLTPDGARALIAGLEAAIAECEARGAAQAATALDAIGIKAKS